MAALISLSIENPQVGQINVLSFNFNPSTTDSFIYFAISSVIIFLPRNLFIFKSFPVYFQDLKCIILLQQDCEVLC